MPLSQQKLARVWDKTLYFVYTDDHGKIIRREWPVQEFIDKVSKWHSSRLVKLIIYVDRYFKDRLNNSYSGIMLAKAIKSSTYVFENHEAIKPSTSPIKLNTIEITHKPSETVNVKEYYERLKATVQWFTAFVEKTKEELSLPETTKSREEDLLNYSAYLIKYVLIDSIRLGELKRNDSGRGWLTTIRSNFMQAVWLAWKKLYNYDENYNQETLKEVLLEWNVIERFVSFFEESNIAAPEVVYVPYINLTEDQTSNVNNLWALLNDGFEKEFIKLDSIENKQTQAKKFYALCLKLKLNISLIKKMYQNQERLMKYISNLEAAITGRLKVPFVWFEKPDHKSKFVKKFIQSHRVPSEEYSKICKWWNFPV